jgi:NADH-ubiquinone oxidoreductase chain 6
MYSLFVLNETYTNGYRVEVLDFISLDSILCGILVIISKNPIVSVLFLIGLFLSISCYLIMLGINFIGLSYLLVYVGAVSILFLLY